MITDTPDDTLHPSHPSKPSVEEFLRDPLEREWDAHLAAGWNGPDGSSCSTDAISGIRIGKTSRRWEARSYPANLHDWRYRLGRHFRLGPNYRREADLEHRRLLIARVRTALVGPFMWAAVARCHVRYWTLRLFGGAAFRS